MSEGNRYGKNVNLKDANLLRTGFHHTPKILQKSNKKRVFKANTPPKRPKSPQKLTNSKSFQPRAKISIMKQNHASRVSPASPLYTKVENLKLQVPKILLKSPQSPSSFSVSPRSLPPIVGNFGCLVNSQFKFDTNSFTDMLLKSNNPDIRIISIVSTGASRKSIIETLKSSFSAEPVGFGDDLEFVSEYTDLGIRIHRFKSAIETIYLLESFSLMDTNTFTKFIDECENKEESISQLYTQRMCQTLCFLIWFSSHILIIPSKNEILLDSTLPLLKLLQISYFLKPLEEKMQLNSDEFKAASMIILTGEDISSIDNFLSSIDVKITAVSNISGLGLDSIYPYKISERSWAHKAKIFWDGINRSCLNHDLSYLLSKLNHLF